MPFEPWFLAAIAANLAGYALYLAGLRRNLVQPNRASWLIWSAAIGIEAATYAAVNPRALQTGVLLLSALACIVVTLVLWRRSAWARPSRSESACMAACLIALLLWAGSGNALWAHLLVVAAVPVSFWPTWASVWEDPAHERSPAWGLWTLGDLATLILAVRSPRGDDIGEYPYLFAELACHASVWLMVGLLSVNPRRSLGERRGRFLVLDRFRRAGNPFRVEDNHLGKAVFAAAPFAEGETLMEFTGRRLSRHEVPAMLHGAGDRFVQVTPDQYMGPSGRLDDLVNHSCDPNAGLRFLADGVFLVATRPIAPGEEIAWDYSTTLLDSGWRMLCQCGSPQCRKVIGDFDTLPRERQEWFRARNFVPPYLRDRDVAPVPQTGWAV